MLKPWLVDRPAARLIGIERRHFIFLVLAILSAQALMSVGMPDLGVALAWDVSSYIDLALLGWTLAAVTNLKAVGRLVAEQWRTLRRPIAPPARPRAKRAPRRPSATRTANDDDHPARKRAA